MRLLNMWTKGSFAFLLMWVIMVSVELNAQSYTNYVNPFIGTGGHGHTYPGAVCPFGMVQLSPDTRLTGWDGCSGYHYSDTIVYGFSHTHLSGTGVPDYADILFLPFQGEIKKYEQKKPGSVFNHKMESASPGLYSVYLEDYQVDVTLTATERCGIHQYAFKNQGKAGIMVDLEHRDKVTASALKVESETEISGYRYSKAWAKDQRIYFVARFSKPIISHDLLNGMKRVDGKEISGDSLRAFLHFGVNGGEKITVKVGISFVDIDGARKNLEQETANLSFDELYLATREKWEKQLSKIQVFGGYKDQNVKFYTALYHTMIVPNLLNDVDGRYRGMDNKIYQTNDGNRYTVFSLWDTFRALHPLYTLIEQERTKDIIKTFIGHYEQTGILPVWELACNETNCMIGAHAIPVISDAIRKGITGFNADKAFDAMKASMAQSIPELQFYRERGYMPSDKVSESVSKTLEYAYDDWCIYQTANDLKKKKDMNQFRLRGQYYKNIYDPVSGFFRPKLNGAFRSPFDPLEVDFNYTEANAWQYLFFAPQDISGLIRLMGGETEFDQKLDQLFSTTDDIKGRHQPDISGLIGQYAHGNEPSHHMAYLYNYIGKPWKTQLLVQQIMDEMYKNAPDGLSGNEDCGQMSAWYVFSALGFYPVTPGSQDYVIGMPQFPRVVINFENGNHFILEQFKSSKDVKYITAVELNKKSHQKSFIRHSDLTAGGKMVFLTGSELRSDWGVNQDDRPVSGIDATGFVAQPYIHPANLSFKEPFELGIYHMDPAVKLFYRMVHEGSKPSKWMFYSDPIPISNSVKVEFYAQDKEKNKSFIESSTFIKIQHKWEVSYETPYSNQYTAGGNDGLIDLLRGNESFSSGRWQGYYGDDFIATLDMKENRDIKSVKIGMLQSPYSWIWFPKSIRISISEDGQHYVEAGIIKNDYPLNSSGTTIKDFELSGLQKNARYIRIQAENIGVCPDWHVGAGEKAWIFMDEIIVE